MVSDLSRRGALALLAAGAASPALAQSARVAIPMLDARDQVIVPAYIEGREIAALVDNGFSVSALDRSFAQENGLARNSRETAVNGASASRISGVRLDLGPLRIFVNPGLIDLSTPARLSEQPIKAIIGMEVFNAAIVGVDFTTSELQLQRRRSYGGPPGARRLDLKGAAGRKHTAEIMVNGTRLRAMIDLGFSSPLAVSPAMAQQLTLAQRSTRLGAQFAGEDVVSRTWGVTSADEIRFAGETFHDIPVDIIPEEGAGPFADHDAIIGLALLRRFDLVFDLNALRLWATPTARIADQFERRFTGLQTEPSARNTLMVIHVAPGSPAEAAGFQRFDIIASIDGAFPTGRRLRDVRERQAVEIVLENGTQRRLTGLRYY